ncbi:hypothetical protein ACJJTC_003389 [Scirpophaga incertulas]
MEDICLTRLNKFVSGIKCLSNNSRDDSIEELRKELQVVLIAREDAKRTCEESNSKNNNFTTEMLLVQESRNKERSRPIKRDITKKVHKRIKPTLTAFSKTHNNKRKLKEVGNSSAHIPKISCIFCGEEHFNDECTKVRTVQCRKTKLNNRCYICFGLGHCAKKCKRKERTCPHCDRRGEHNRALCPKKVL